MSERIRVIVGEKGVLLAKAVDELDLKIKDATKDLAPKKTLLDQLIPAGMDVANFVVILPHPDVAKEIEDKEKELAETTAAFNRAAEIKSKGLLTPVTLPTFPASFAELLAETLETMQQDAELAIQRHIKGHTNGATEEWLSKGLDYSKDETCPFCGQQTRKLDLLASYQSIFNASYRDLKKKLADFKKWLPVNFGGNSPLPAQKSLSENGVLIEFWKQFTPLTMSTAISYDAVQACLNDVREIADGLLDKKIASPLDPVLLLPTFEEALAKYNTFFAIATAYNGEVSRANEQVTKVKAQAHSGDPVKVKKELDALTLIRKRWEPVTVQTLKEYRAADKLKRQLEKDKLAAKKQLDEYSDTVLKDCEKRINQLLGMFGAGFRIADTKRSYVGARVSSTYHIVINGHPVELGDSATPIQAASFRNTLSAGDKSTLALIFFIVQAERDPNLNQKTLVFDDPFSSQDRSRRACTQQFLCKLAKAAKQTIVFSHDPYFLRSVWDEAKALPVKALQLSRMGSGTGTLILEWDIENETQGDYVKMHRLLWSYFYEAQGDPRTVVQCIRPLLEKYLRMKLPHEFADNEWLGDFIRKIREADPTSPLDAGKIILPEVESINDYSKKYHHGSNANADTEPIDDSELQAYVKRTLDLVGGF